jgi:hypothetical protein
LTNEVTAHATVQRICPVYLLDFYGQQRLAKAVQKWLPSRPPLAVFEPGTPNEASETNARWRLMMNAQLAF